MVNKVLRLFLVIFVSFFLLIPRISFSQILTFNVRASRIKVAVVPGGTVLFRFSINNLSTIKTDYRIEAKLVNQTQNFSFLLTYQNKPIEELISINPSSSKEIVVTIYTAQSTSMGAKGAININVKPDGSSDAQKQGVLLNFIVTNQITMLLTQNSSKVQLSDQDPVTLDSAPYIQGGRTYVPLRFIGESFGATIEWIQSDKKIVYKLRGQEISLWINQTRIITNGTEKEMDSPPEIKPPGRTFVPLRIISEELGAKVEWNEISRQIKIIYKVD